MEYRRSLKDRLSPPCGKPKGAVLHPGSLAAAEAEDRKLVCFHCGVACDLDGMKRERTMFHAELETLAESRPEIERGEALRYRLIYRKLGPATTLSHLDLVRLWPRALRRAGLPVAYSQGFHPHPRLSFTPALPMGAQSLGEQIEIKLETEMEPDAVIAAITPTLPAGIEILSCTRGEGTALSKRLRSFEMLVEFSGGPAADELNSACRALLTSESILLKRLRKRGEMKLELRPTLLGLRPARGDERFAQPATAEAGSEAAKAPNEDARRIVVRLAVQGAALKAAELVALLGGDSERMRVQRLGFELEEVEHAGA
jgi:radical SAM-linked protein